MTAVDELLVYLPPGETHEVVNQSGPTPDHDAYTADNFLARVTEEYDLGWAANRFTRLGRVVGSQHTEELARLANRHEPEVRLFDRFGRRIDEVEFHPAYHELMRLAFTHEVHSLAWTGVGPNPHTARAVLSYLWNQAENGVSCPSGMTYAAIVAMRRAGPELAAVWEPKIVAAGYDPRPLHVAQKSAVTIGMAMTEKQGGSDLRKVRTVATPLDGQGGPGARYRIVGHKWFTSAPMCDGFFTLAQTEEGVSCFFFERWHADGSRNRMLIQRLKDKCGNRSNASSEIELDGVIATLVGEPGHGIRTILEQGHLVRLDFAIGSAGLMRKALTHTLHHARRRLAFDRPLTQLPMMRSLLADIALEVEATTLLALRFTAATDRAEIDEHEALLARVGAPLAKYWNCRQVVGVVTELLECHGGNGFIEEGPMARLYREAPLNAIWEGTSNMMCLDVLRSVRRVPHAAEALIAELRSSKGSDGALSAEVAWIEEKLRSDDDLEPVARLFVERLARALQAKLMLDLSTDDAANAFLGSRIRDRRGAQYGAVQPHHSHSAIIERAAVTV